MGLVESGFANLFLMIGFATGLGIPNGIPPGPEDPAMMKIAPQECVFYTSWAGMAQPKAENQNHTEQLLAEPQVRDSLERWRQIVGAAVGRLGHLRGPNTAAAAKDAEEIGRLIMSRPGAVFVTHVRRTPQGLDFQAGAIANLGNDVERVRGLLEKHQRILFGQEIKPVTEGNATWYRFRRPDGLAVTFGTSGQYLIFGIGERAAEGIVERMGGNAPPWLVNIHQRVPVDRRATTMYFQTAGLRDFLSSWMGPEDTRQLMDAIGLSNVRYMANVTGLDRTGFISRSFTDIQGQPQGLFAIGSQQPIQPADLAPVPQDAITAVVVRADPGQLWDALAGILRTASQPTHDRLMAQLNFVERRANFNFRRDLVPALGNTFYLFDTGPKGKAGNDQEQASRTPLIGRRPLSGVMFVAAVRDAKRLETLRGQLDRAFEGVSKADMQRTESQVNGHKMVEIRLGNDPDARPFAFGLTDKHLVFSTSVEGVRAFLNRPAQAPSLANVREVGELFKAGGGPVAIAYQDSPRVLDQVYPDLQSIARVLEAALPAKEGQTAPLLPPADVIRKHLRPTIAAVRWSDAGLDSFVHQTLPGANAGISGPLVIGGLLSGARLAGEVAQRDSSAQNLQKIAAALVQYERVNNQFPPSAIPDQQGRPLLSWRVLILPTLGHDALYRKFRLNEPWDSPHNRQLIGQIPDVFRSPLSNAEKGMTTYLAVTGENTVFSGGQPAALGEQATRTAMLVEGNDLSSVIWTQPSDFHVQPAAPMTGLAGLGRLGFLVAFADGRVRFVSEQTTPDAVLAMFTLGQQQPPLTARRPGRQTNGQQTPAVPPAQPSIRR